MQISTGSCGPLIERRLLGDRAPERQRLELNQWQGKNRTYHGVRLELPESRASSHK